MRNGRDRVRAEGARAEEGERGSEEEEKGGATRSASAAERSRAEEAVPGGEARR